MASCGECGREVPDGSRFCFCGNDLARPSVPAPRGVGGWLLFFCISTTVVAPLLVMGSLVILVLALVGVAVSGGDSHVAAFLLMSGAASIVVAASGAYAGLRLWLVRSNALATVRVYLVILGIAGVFHAVLPGLLLPIGLADQLLPHGVVRAVATAGGAAFWWLYFSHSRRVKATYGPRATAA